MKEAAARVVASVVRIETSGGQDIVVVGPIVRLMGSDSQGRPARPPGLVVDADKLRHH